MGGEKDRKQLWEMTCYFRSILELEASVAELNKKTEMLPSREALVCFGVAHRNLFSRTSLGAKKKMTANLKTLFMFTRELTADFAGKPGLNSATTHSLIGFFLH